MQTASEFGRCSARQRGFSLIEALIAIVVLALGLLGTLGMIVNSLKLTSSSNYRTIAAQQAVAMAEQLRANPIALGTMFTEQTYNPPAPVLKTACMSASATGNAAYADTSGANVSAGGCARSDYINNGVQTWRDQLAASMPQGTGWVCRDSDPDSSSHAPVQSAPSGGTPGAVTSWGCDGSGEYVVKVCWNETRIGASTEALGIGGFLCTWTSL